MLLIGSHSSRPVQAGLFNYDANDRFTAGDTYDSNGNTISSGGVNNVYDFENHLIQKDGVTMLYDGDGSRTFKTVAGVTTGYLVDDRNPTGYTQVLDELQGSNFSRSYVYGLEMIEQDVVSSGFHVTTSYNVYDGHGSVRALTNLSGAVTDTYDYDAFGNIVHSTGSTPNNYLYSGEQFDPDLHLYYNRARYLNVTTGRFWTMDSIEGSPADPKSLHRYAYGEGDPIDLLDPLGQYSQSFGYDVEAEVEKQYEFSHPGDVVSFGKWARLPGGYRLKPDILNFTELKYQEIKPISIGGVTTALAQMGLYYLAFSQSGFEPDTTWFPPSQPFFVQNTPVVVINAEGVLFYTDQVQLLKEAAALATIAAVRQILITLGVRSLRLAGPELLPRRPFGLSKGLSQTFKPRLEPQPWKRSTIECRGPWSRFLNSPKWPTTCATVWIPRLAMYL